MEIVTHIVAADDDEYQAVGDSINPLDEWSGIEAPRLDTIKIATLHSLLTGDPLQVALDLYEPVYVAENETVVLRIADELMEKLATLDEDELENVAIEVAATEEFETEQWDTEDIQEQLILLGDLAQLAESQGQALFVWMCLLQD
ncbi:conserved hypothetical protein [Candidatus Propionivibrio aalborgensis]|uniref:Uncharacterized protein n=1 Tax=Candidatus Propionivibrio aalborgensis TaxID=1860101 RepID=A0A1A8Y1L1_9RHOO|nr:hypothetical protein [Candidatus Propionivibrio aalborgensis]MBK7325617.1 hypothetical protein [Propionivibrio sp.]MBK9029176.1 hypothetical protein [Propionivibrio sp.]SBT11019.1 conserved hypothetical protein [Candidatus Propionivibrio aalborgensis]HRC61343.1 hypothetical protein [Candidatus Propionivibrio aalborgensis]